MIKKKRIWMAGTLCLCLAVFSGCGKTDEAKDYSVSRENGIAFYQEGDYSRAADCFSEALQDLGEDGEQEALVDILKYRADAELQCGKAEEAAADYSQLLSFDNECADYYLLRGRAFAELGDTEAAVSDFRTVKLASDGNLSYCEDMYVTLRDYGAAGAGMEFLDEIIFSGRQGEEDLRYDRACLEKALFQMESRNYEEALSLIQAAGQQADEAYRKDFLYAEAVCYEELLDFETALEKFRTYRENYRSDEAVEQKLDHEIAFLETRVYDRD